MMTLRHWWVGVLATLWMTVPAFAATVGVAPRVDGFDVEEVAQLSPGTALRFTLYGTPGGAATLQIAGVDRSLVLQETQAGIYEGVYTVAAGDRIAADSRVSADLALGQRVTSAVLEEPLVLGASGFATTALGTTAPATTAVGATASGAPVIDTCSDCGVVQAIREVEVRGQPGYRGAAGRGVLGAILGGEFADDVRRTAARIVGAVGGGHAGRENERASKRRTHYDVVIRLDNGDVQTRSLDAMPPFKVGDRVRVVQGRPERDLAADRR